MNSLTWRSVSSPPNTEIRRSASAASKSGRGSAVFSGSLRAATAAPDEGAAPHRFARSPVAAASGPGGEERELRGMFDHKGIPCDHKERRKAGSLPRRLGV